MPSAFIAALIAFRNAFACLFSHPNQVSEASLLGVLITERWIDPKTNTYYSLAELDLNWVMENLGSMNIDPQLKDFVRKVAQSKFTSFEK